MEEIINQLLVVGEGLVLLGFSWLIWFISGVANNLFSPKKWSWKRMAEDVVKTLLMVVATLSWVVVITLLEHYTSNLGVDITKLLDGVSVVGLIGIICGGAAIYVYKAYRNIIKFFVKNHTELEEIEKNIVLPDEISAETYAQVAEPAKQVIDGIFQYFEQSKDSVEAHRLWEEQGGGLGSTYSVAHDTYANFRAAVINRGFNIDNAYGAQCWDGTGLLYQQVGMWLQTGNGCAYGCWTLKREANLGSKFIAITDKRQIKRGDILVFRAGEYGHIGFADENYTGRDYIALLGQNQGGIPYSGGGSCFNVINMSLNTFLGAFRYKEWGVKEEAKPATETINVSANAKKGDYVEVKRLVNVDGKPMMSLQTSYLVIDANDTMALLQTDDGEPYGWMYQKDIKVVDKSSDHIVQKETQQRQEQSSGFKEGDNVKFTGTKDYDGRTLKYRDRTYTIKQIRGDRVALYYQQPNNIWAAVKIDEIKKA